MVFDRRTLLFQPNGDLLPRHGFTRVATRIQGDATGPVHENQTPGERLVERLHLALLGIEQTDEGQLIVVHAFLDAPPMLYLEILRRVRTVEEPLKFFGEFMRAAMDVNEQELDPLAIGLMQLAEVNHLLAENVSAKAAEEEDDRLVFPKIAELNRSFPIEARQSKVRSRQTYRQSRHVGQDIVHGIGVIRPSRVLPSRLTDIDSGDGQCCQAQTEGHHHADRAPGTRSAKRGR
jgi:hypothetical protein